MSSREDYVAFFLSGKVQHYEIETLEISHPAFSRVYYIVRNVMEGIALNDENGAQRFFEYYPLKLEDEGASNDLDYGLNIQLGDLNEIIALEEQNLMAQDSFDIKPQIIYRAYHSGTLEIMNGPLVLEAASIPYSGEGAALRGGAPNLNISGTGIRYDTNRFPSIREFMK